MADFNTDADPAVPAACFQAARDRFARAGEYPLIDDAEIIEDKVVYDFWPWECSPSGRRGTDALIQRALAGDHRDLPVRFVYLNLFFRLAHYPAEKIASVVEDQENAAGYRAQFLEHLETLIGLIEPNDCEDPRNIRWEIVNACSVRRWPRVRQLYDRLEALAEKREVVQVLAQRGQQECLSVFADLWELSDPWCWAQCHPDEQLSRVLMRILCYRCVVDRGARSFSAEELERLRDAAHHLGKAIRAKQDLSPVYRFLLLRCSLALGEFHESARTCEELLGTREIFTGLELLEDKPALVSALYASLVEAAESAGDVERAISANRRWIEEFPNEPGTLKRLSDLFWSQGDKDNAIDCLRKEVDRNPALGEEPAVSMALAFGAVHRSVESRAADFEKQVDPEKLGRMGIVVRVHWPEVEQLGAGSVEDWVRACHCLFWHDLDDPGLPVFYLTRLVESELRVRVFSRFRRSLTQSELQSIRKGKETDPLTRYLEKDRLSLGEMLNEFHYWDKPRSEASRRFRSWLHHRGTGLVQFLQEPDLQRLAGPNIDVKHCPETPLSWNKAADMARLSRWLLSALIAHERDEPLISP